MRMEQTILTNLIYENDYTRRVLPFLKDEYFQDATEKQLFLCIESFIHKYNGLPTKETLLIELNQREDLNENLYKKIVDYVDEITYEKKNDEWLINKTEEFCQE